MTHQIHHALIRHIAIAVVSFVAGSLTSIYIFKAPFGEPAARAQITYMLAMYFALHIPVAVIALTVSYLIRNRRVLAAIYLALSSLTFIISVILFPPRVGEGLHIFVILAVSSVLLSLDYLMRIQRGKYPATS
jgi:hypothetical protein